MRSCDCRVIQEMFFEHLYVPDTVFHAGQTVETNTCGSGPTELTVEPQNISAGWSLKHNLSDSIFYSHRKWGTERETWTWPVSFSYLVVEPGLESTSLDPKPRLFLLKSLLKHSIYSGSGTIAVCKLVRSTTIVCVCIYYIRTKLVTIGNKSPNLSGLNNRRWFLPFVKTFQQLKFTQSDSVISKPSLGFWSSSGKTSLFLEEAFLWAQGWKRCSQSIAKISRMVAPHCKGGWETLCRAPRKRRNQVWWAVSQSLSCTLPVNFIAE